MKWKLFSFIVWFLTPILLCANNEGIANSETTPDLKNSKIFNFPSDHHFHSGPRYKNKLYMEWYYWSGILRNKENREQEYGIFFAPTRGFKKDNFKLYFCFGLIDLKNGGMKSVRFTIEELMESVGNDSSRGGPFYRLESPCLKITYWEKTDRWEVWMDNGKEGDDHVACTLNMTGNHKYMPQSPNGIVEIGDGIKYPYDLDEMTALSYYYSGFNQKTEGKMVLNGKDFEVEGSMWMDHQWGNFRIPPWRYDWLSLRFNNGVRMMYYQLLDEDSNVIPGLSGTSYFPAQPAHAQSIIKPKYDKAGTQLGLFRPLRPFFHTQYKDPEYIKNYGDCEYPIRWKISETPFGDLYVVPVFDNQEFADLFGYPLWEGVAEIHKDSEDGEVIGTVFLEIFRQ